MAPHIVLKTSFFPGEVQRNSSFAVTCRIRILLLANEITTLAQARTIHMKKTNMQLKAADLHAGTTDALYTYMADCQFNEAHLTSMCLSLALEYVYQPRPRFWQNFDLMYLVTAMNRC